MDVQDWFGPASLVSFGTASVAVTAVVNTIRALSNRMRAGTVRRVAFGCCLAVTAVAMLLRSPTDPVAWLLMPLNACVLFCTTLGLNEVSRAGAAQRFAGTRRFFDSWLKDQIASAAQHSRDR